MRPGDCEGFADKEKAEELLNALLTEHGTKVINAEVEPTLYARPGNVFYQISVVYHDPEKTPYPVCSELRSAYDYEHLVVDGCVHEYSLGTMSQNYTGELWSHVSCHACKGGVIMDQDEVIAYILAEKGKLTYERWEGKKNG